MKLYLNNVLLSAAALLLGGCGYVSFGVKGSLFKDKNVVAPLDPIPVNFAIKTPFSSASGTARVDLGLCRKLEVVATDKKGKPARVRRDTTVMIENFLSAQFYTDEDCTVSANPSSLVFPADSDSLSIYFRNNNPDNMVLKTRASGFSASERTIKVDPTIVRLDFSISPTLVVAPEGSVTAGRCRELYVIPSRGDNLVVNTLDVRLYPFSVALTGAGAGNYFSNPECTTSISALTLTHVGDSRKVYYRNPNKNTNVMLEANPNSGNIGAAITVSTRKASKSLAIADGPIRIGIINEPTTQNSTPSVGICRSYKVQLQDLNGIGTSDMTPRTVTLTGKVGANVDAGEFYSSLTNCQNRSGAVSSANLSFQANDQSYIVAFRISNLNVVDNQTVTLRATTGDLTEGTLLLTAKVDLQEIAVDDSEAPPAKTKICNGPYRVTTKDGRGKAFPAVLKVSSDIVGHEFASDPLCMSALSVNAFNVPSSGATYYTREPSNVNVVRVTLQPQAGAPPSTVYVENLTQPLLENPDFGNNGLSLDPVPFTTTINGMAAQGNNTILVGTQVRTISNQQQTHIYVRRNDVNGNLDNTFGTNGEIFYHPTSSTYSSANAVTVDTAGNIYIVGKITVSGDDDLFVARIATNFAVTERRISFGTSSMDEGFAIALSGNRIIMGGKRVAAGATEAILVSCASISTAPDWSANLQFAAGIASEIRGLALLAGNVFASGNAGGQVGLAKYDLSGTQLAVRRENFAPLVVDVRALAVQNGSRLVVGGSATGGASGTRDVFMAGFNNLTALDTTFGDGTGKSLIATNGVNDMVYAMAIYSNVTDHPDSGKIVLAGNVGSSAFVQRYTALGTIEPIVTATRKTADFGGTDSARGVVIRTIGTDSRILIGGDDGLMTVGQASYLR